MISLTDGFDLTANESAPGVLNFWIGNVRMVPNSTSGAITAFTGTGSPEWFKFECGHGEGDYVTTPGQGSGGLEYVTTGNYRIGGLSQGKLDTIDSLMKSQRLSIVAEHTDGTFYLISGNGASFNGGTIGSGTGAAGGAAVGAPLTFVSQGLANRSVTVATDLDSITTS